MDTTNNMKHIKLETSPYELNILHSHIDCEASTELCELGNTLELSINVLHPIFMLFLYQSN